MADRDKSYVDENLPESEKESGRMRLPLPNEEGIGSGKEGKPSQPEEAPYPGEENRADKNFERPDEFGDGDRRS